MDKYYFLTSKKMLTDVKGPIIIRIYAYTEHHILQWQLMSEMRNEHPVFQTQTSDQIWHKLTCSTFLDTRSNNKHTAQTVCMYTATIF